MGVGKFFCVLCLLLATIAAQESTVSMDFQGVDLNLFLQWFANITNKKIIHTQERQAGGKKIYLISHEPVPEKSVEAICMSLLESNGLTLVKVGKDKSEVYKLIETTNASSKPIALYSMSELEKIESGDYYISQLILIKHLKAANVIASLQQARLLDQKSGSVVEIRGANAIIVNDFLPNVRRIIGIIQMLDQPPPKIEMAFVTLKYAKSDEISQKLQQLYQNKARELAEYNTSSVAPTIISDARTNSLTLRGSPEEIAELKELIARFDKEVKESELIVRIYSLEHVPADKILPTLREFIATPIFREKTINTTANNQQNANISIIAHDQSRSLLVTAPAFAHNLIKGVIERFDVRRPQVLLEAVICEFTPSDVLNLGIELLSLDNRNNNFSSNAITSFGLSSIVDQAGSPITGQRPATPAGRLVAPGAGFTTFFSKDKETNIPFLLRALQSVTHTEVISMPKIITDDGERAEIRVQQEEPVTSVSALNTSTTTTSFKEFVSAGTVLIIRPQIIHKDWLRLEIEQNIEAFVGSSPAPGVPPPKSSRSIKTIVTVPNRRTVILGGLCGRREIETVDKIPVLGDIPLLGLLFQSRSKSVSKTNLYIFITPRILNDKEFKDLEKISQEDQKKVEELQGRTLEEQRQEVQKK